MSDFKIGDKVKVVDAGKTFSYHEEWAGRARLSNWKCGNRHENGKVGKVVAVAPWELYRESHYGMLLAVEIDGKQAIIEDIGVVKVQTPAEKAGLVIGERYWISEESDHGRGVVVYFVEDDGSSIPFFNTKKDGSGGCYVPHVNEVTPYKPNTVIEFDKVLTQAQIDAIKTLVA